MTGTPGQKSSCGHVAQPAYCEAKMEHLREQMDLQLKAMNVASEKSAAILDERLERMNEFRAAMEDQGRRFVTREELDLKLAVLTRDVQALRDFTAELRGKASAVSVYVSWVLAVAALAVSLLAVLK